MTRSRTAAFAALAVVLLAAARPAAADDAPVYPSHGPAGVVIQKDGPQVYPGRMELSAQIGGQSPLTSFGLKGTPPGGLRILADFNYSLRDFGVWSLWLNAGLGGTIGFGCPANMLGIGGNYGCGGYGSGSELQPLVGIKLKFKPPVPVVPYVRADAYFSWVFDRYCTDMGYGFGVRVGGGAKYFITNHLGVGLEVGFSMGPTFYQGAPAEKCSVNFFFPAHTEAYVTVDYVAGIEYAF